MRTLHVAALPFPSPWDGPKTVSLELAGTGVSVTSVEPGLMRTGSHLQASFVGDQGREYAWFATAASLPQVGATSGQR